MTPYYTAISTLNLLKKSITEFKQMTQISANPKSNTEL